MADSREKHSIGGSGTGHPVGDAWNRYWAGGQLAACFGDSLGQYGGPIAQLWRDFFAGLPQKCKLLDLATGNGAIALMAVQAGFQLHKNFSVHAVDLAAINPVCDLENSTPQLAEIQFYPGTPAENTPFDDGYFDVVISQYGFEYTHVSATLRELSRVTHPGGRLQMVVHAREGSVYTASDRTRVTISRLLQELAIIDAARAMVRQVMLLERGPRPVAAVDEQQFFTSRKRYERAVDSLQQEMRDPGCRPMVANVIEVIHHAFNHRGDFKEAEILHKLDELETELRCHAARLDALMQAAMGQSELESLQQESYQAGFVDFCYEPVMDPSRGLIAYRISARRQSKPTVQENS